MRTWLKVENDCYHAPDINWGAGRYRHICDMCKAKGLYIEAVSRGVYDSEALDPPNNIVNVKLCTRCRDNAVKLLKGAL